RLGCGRSDPALRSPRKARRRRDGRGLSRLRRASGREPHMSLLQPGQVLHHYEVITLLGETGMGEVYRGFDLRLERPIVLKMLTDEAARHEEAVQRLRSEARFAAAIQHPNIVAIHAIEEFMNEDFLVMEFVEG